MSDEKTSSGASSESSSPSKMEEVFHDLFPGIPKMADPRPTDLQYFLAILPHILGGAAAKNSEAHSALSSAFVFARMALGQCVALGAVRYGFVCNDRSSLAMMPQGVQVQGVQPPISQQQASGNGVMVAQHPNQPGFGQAGASSAGPGGLVSQHPNQPPPVAHGSPNLGGGDGSRGVMVAQFPNGTTPPPL